MLMLPNLKTLPFAIIKHKIVGLIVVIHNLFDNLYISFLLTYGELLLKHVAFEAWTDLS